MDYSHYKENSSLVKAAAQIGNKCTYCNQDPLTDVHWEKLPMGKLCIETLIMNCPENPNRLKGEKKVVKAKSQVSIREEPEHFDFEIVEKEDASAKPEDGTAPETEVTREVDPSMSSRAVEVQGQ